MPVFLRPFQLGEACFARWALLRGCHWCRICWISWRRPIQFFVVNTQSKKLLSFRTQKEKTRWVRQRGRSCLFFCERGDPGSVAGKGGKMQETVYRYLESQSRTPNCISIKRLNWWKDLLFLTFMTNVIHKIHKDKWSERMKQFYSKTFRRITPSSVGRLIERMVRLLGLPACGV